MNLLYSDYFRKYLAIMKRCSDDVRRVGQKSAKFGQRSAEIGQISAKFGQRSAKIGQTSAKFRQKFAKNRQDSAKYCQRSAKVWIWSSRGIL